MSNFERLKFEEKGSYLNKYKGEMEPMASPGFALARLAFPTFLVESLTVELHQ